MNPIMSCYNYNTNVRMPWYEAEGDCSKKGGHLVVISSAAENDVVYGIVGGENRKTWIGLSNYGQVIAVKKCPIIFVSFSKTTVSVV